jgi:hypothetical protein
VKRKSPAGGSVGGKRKAKWKAA